jgi:penicillin-binding protein 1A
MDAQQFRGNFDAGDVVHVRRMTQDDTDSAFIRWTLRQVLQKCRGAFMAMDVNTGRVLAMQGGLAEIRLSEQLSGLCSASGSAFKPFVLLRHWIQVTRHDSRRRYRSVSAGGEIWRPQNYSNQYWPDTAAHRVNNHAA